MAKRRQKFFFDPTVLDDSKVVVDYSDVFSTSMMSCPLLNRDGNTVGELRKTNYHEQKAGGIVSTTCHTTAVLPNSSVVYAQVFDSSTLYPQSETTSVPYSLTGALQGRNVKVSETQGTLASGIVRGNGGMFNGWNIIIG
jgi:hypothetical protein